MRAARTLRLGALGAVAAQGSQALASFGLQLVAARSLGAAGLGRFAVLYGLILVATAVSSGFVGDSLTVLDRNQASIRLALQWWLAAIAIAAGLLLSGGSSIVDFLSVGDAVVFGLATAAFVVEDTIRRLLMATLRFWRIVAVDLAALVGALAVLAAVATIDLGAVLWALAAGQIVASAVGWMLLPSNERTLASGVRPSLGPVARYGSWRASQQAVRAGALALVRVVALIVVSEAAVGELAAARIYMAPTVLIVGGVSSFLFAAYASSNRTPVRALLAHADRSVAILAVSVSLVGAGVIALIPWLGPLLTDGQFEISMVMAAGWAAYAVSIASVSPYGQLASVRGQERPVFLWRAADSLASVISTYIVARMTGTVTMVPLVIAVWPALSGLAIRQLVIGRRLLDVGRHDDGQEG